MTKEEKAEDAIYKYMKSQNRPYSAGDVFSNLHKSIGKTAIVKALESLVAEKKLVEKVYGKSKIYVINQDEFPTVCEEEVQKLDEEIKMLGEKCEKSQGELKKVKSELKSFLSTMTTEDANDKVRCLREEVKTLKNRLAKAESLTQGITEEDRKKIYLDHKTFVTQWRKRKRMTTDLMGAVLEGYPKSKKTFIEEVGIETDEECNAKIPET